MSSKKSALEPLRVRIRRFQFIVGLGFISLVAGSVLTVSLWGRLRERMEALPLLMQLLAEVALKNLWVLAVLPALCYVAARVMELRPWTTAAGAAVSGATFVLALNYVQSGTDGLWLGGLGSVLNVVAFALGVGLSGRAVTRGRAAAAQQSTKAQSKAQERKSEYDEFLRAAEAGGARLEQREAAAQPQAPDAAQAQAPDAAQAQAPDAAASPDSPDTGKNSAA